MKKNERDVFINCPFDSAYQPIFDGILFAVIRSGLQPRAAKEEDDGGTNRLEKILRLIRDCPFGIHDISRTETDGDPPLPRFNMPLELGLFLGAKTFGAGTLKKKQCLILDSDDHRYLRSITDIRGHDIKSHANDPAKAISRVTDWLRNHSGFSGIPGGRKVASEYAEFQKELPALCAAQEVDVAEMGFNERLTIIAGYVTTAKPTALGGESEPDVVADVAPSA
ncbi:MAG: hypothetical protein ACWA6X_11545 [Bauldia sp.]